MTIPRERPASGPAPEIEAIIRDVFRDDDVAADMANDPRGVAARLLITDPRLLELPPRTAVEAQIHFLHVGGAFRDVSAWLRPPGEALRRIAASGERARRSPSKYRKAAEGAFDGGAQDKDIIAVPVRCWGVPYGALVGAGGHAPERKRRELLEVAARAVAVVVERDMLLARSAAREQLLLEGTERRLARTGLDIHDGPVQALSAASVDVALLRRQLGDLTRDDASAALARGRLDDVTAALDAAHESLRAIAQFLGTGAASIGSLPETVERDARRLAARFGLAIGFAADGTFDHLSTSQRICALRVVHEALSNVAEHSGARGARVTLASRSGTTIVEIIDDGAGFDVERTLVSAARRGRLGLVGMSERARLLGGTLDVRSSIGGPTTIRLVLPDWQPLSREDEAEARRDALSAGFAARAADQVGVLSG